jgi:hypothetical protein
MEIRESFDKRITCCCNNFRNYNKWDIENNASAVLKKIYSSFDIAE